MKRLFAIVGLCACGITGQAQLSADFETGHLNGWVQAPENAWSATSATGVLSGRFSLRHTLGMPSGAYTDCISTAIYPFTLNDGETVWRFRMKYPYNPTATNQWAVVLMADTDASQWGAAGFNGYAVGVNRAAGVSDKRLCLYAVHNDGYAELIKTPVHWVDSIGTSSSTTVSIQVSRSITGEWTLWAGKNTTFDRLTAYGTAVHAGYAEARYFGAINRYTSSSAGGQKLWLDDITVTSADFPATIVSVEQRGSRALAIRFSKPMRPDGLQSSENYTLSGGTTAVHPEEVAILSPTELLLTFAALLPRGNATVSVQNLRDENNRPVTGGYTLSILYFLYGDVVFNEIMASPAPAVDLPEVSYIELFNRLDSPVSLAGWKIEYLSTESSRVTVGNIGASVIPANGYIILCTSAVVNDMLLYGNAASVSNLSSLTQSGKTIQLKNSDDQLVARLTYSNKWITDDAKRAGGWSLEKIDPGNLSESPANWTASVDRKGGTPGQPNSALDYYPDEEPPFVVSLGLTDDRTLQLTFNEFFDTLSAQHPAAYSTGNNTIPQEAEWNVDSPEQVRIRFAQPFTEGMLYRLTVTEPFCDLAGNAPKDTFYYFGRLFPPRQHDVVINEVLFNPYPNGVDFVEIYNRSDRIFNLQQIQLAHRDKNNEVASIHSVPTSYFLPPGEYAVFTVSPEAVQSFYSVPFPEKIITLTGLPSYPDDAGCVVLLSDEGELLDEWTYTQKMHSGFIAHPEGISLERVNPDRPSNESSNWQSAAQHAGFATPTGRNSQFNTAAAETDSYFSLPYPVFSPDGDGYHDVLFIDYQMPESGYVATLTVYDLQGRLVKAMENKTLLGISGRFSWDGTRYDNHKVSPGMYVLFIEYFNLEGAVRQVKKSCAVATR